MTTNDHGDATVRHSVQDVDVLVVGAGFAGLYMLYRLRELRFDVCVVERGDGVGGTWYWNRYPGARCDVESMEYSYSFSAELQQEWEWTERYAGQPEILKYLNHVADRFDLRKDIQFNTEVEAAHYDDRAKRWNIQTACGRRFSAQFVVMATGCLSSHNVPKFDGVDRFEGNLYHTGQWPHEPVDFSGQELGIIGTGSSAIQAIPHLAEQAGQLTVFQRTPNYSVPARNQALEPQEMETIKANYPQLRAINKLMPAALGARSGMNNQSALEADAEERDRLFHERWLTGGFGFLGAFNDLTVNRQSNELAASYVRDRIRETVVDPEVAEMLLPDNVIGCKRLCLDTGYFETYNRPNVKLIDVNEEPIIGLTANGIETTNREYEFDSVIFATGFDAMTGTLLRIDIRGRDGITLAAKWAAGPRTYLGLTVAGFPNMFMISGPGSPSVLTNMVVSIEQHVDWVCECISDLHANQLTTIESTVEAEDAWVERVNQIADQTLYPTCNSWYLGANVPGKPRVFMPHVGFPSYVEKCDEVVNNEYEGFVRQ